MRNRPLTLPEKQAVREFYNGSYPASSNYVARHPWNEMIAQYRVDLTRAVFRDLGKVLDAGCAGGGEVAAFRRNDIDAWGFDICPDLHDIAYPEVRDFVRMGRLDYIPFSREDGFRTLVSHDVIEHIPIDCLERFPFEISRLGITQMALIISKDTVSPGHITIQDKSYYVHLFAQAGFRLMSELDPLLAPVMAPVAWNHQQNTPIIAPYTRSGSPRNGWNEVPGHLFFTIRS
jgi:hypothetical protein